MIHLAIDVVGVKHSGGATVLLDLLAEAIPDKRIDRITLFSSPRSARNFDLPRTSKIEEIEVPRGERSTLYRIWWYEYILGNECIRIGADVLLCMGGMGRAKPPIPHITYIQQSLPFSKEALNRCSRPLRYRMGIIKQLVWRSSRKSAKIVVQTPTMRNWVSECFSVDKCHIRVILPFPRPLPVGDTEGSTLNQMYATPTGQRLLYVGNQSPYKNLEVVLQGMHQVRRALPDAILFLTCPPDHSSCRQEGVVGLGYLDKAELRKAYELAACLVQPSLVETVSLPLLEAMCIGTPILAADRPYAHDVCGSAAMFFDPLSSEDFASKAIALLQNKVQYNELVRKGTLLINSIQEAKPYSQLLEVVVQTVRAL